MEDNIKKNFDVATALVLNNNLSPLDDVYSPATRDKLHFWLDGIEKQNTSDNQELSPRDSLGLYNRPSSWGKQLTAQLKGFDMSNVSDLLKSVDVTTETPALRRHNTDPHPFHNTSFLDDLFSDNRQPLDSLDITMADSSKFCPDCDKLRLENVRLQHQLEEATRKQKSYQYQAEKELHCLRQHITRLSTASPGPNSIYNPPALAAHSQLSSPSYTHHSKHISEPNSRRHRIPTISVVSVPFDANNTNKIPQAIPSEDTSTDDSLVIEVFSAAPSTTTTPTASPAINFQPRLARYQNSSNGDSVVNSPQVGRKPKNIEFCSYSIGECPLGDACTSLHVNPIVSTALRKVGAVRGVSRKMQ